MGAQQDKPPYISDEEKKKPLTDLLKQLCVENGQESSVEDVKEMGFGELRDAVLAFDPLDVAHVKRCNKAEAQFWKKNEGYQIRPSDELLQFDCGDSNGCMKFAFSLEHRKIITTVICLS